MKIIDLKQGSDEWKAFRRSKIGASMAGTIMGVNPWETKLDLWESIINGDEKVPTEAMIRGSQLESKARDEFNSLFRAEHQFHPIVVQHDQYDWLIASLDGWNGEECVEIKCPGEKTHNIALSNKIPDYYYPQLQHQMMVTDTKVCTYLSYDGSNAVCVFCSKDDAYCEKLFRAEKEFYQSLIDFKPPKESDQDRIEMVDKELVEKTNNLTTLQAIIDQAQEEYDEIKAQIVAKVAHPRVRIGNMNISKIIRKGAIEYDKIEALKGVDLEQYRKKPIESWRITVNEN